MTEATMIKRYKAAYRQLTKAIRAYKRLARKCYVQQDNGSFVPLSELVLTKSGSLDTGAFMALRRSHFGGITLYRFGRDGKPYVEPYKCSCGKRQSCTHCDFCDGKSCDYDDDKPFFCRDYQAIVDIESTIEDGMYKCEYWHAALKDIGIDAYSVLFDS